MKADDAGRSAAFTKADGTPLLQWQAAQLFSSRWGTMKLGAMQPCWWEKVGINCNTSMLPQKSCGSGLLSKTARLLREQAGAEVHLVPPSWATSTLAR